MLLITFTKQINSTSGIQTSFQINKEVIHIDCIYHNKV